MRILVVEDDKLTAEALKALFIQQNYAVEIASNGRSAIELVESFEYDFILADVMLPEMDGISLCRQVRSQGHKIPILLLTGRDNAHDKAVGLDAGADDFVVKPYDPEELAARVRALLRRGEATDLPILTWENLNLDPQACEVSYNGTLLQLTPKEYALLELLMRNHRRVFSCGMILEHLWTYEETPGEEAVRTHIKGLRQKLKVAGAPADVIETVYGIGYRLKPLSELAKSEVLQEPELLPQSQQQTLNAIADIWVKFQPRIRKQVDLLEQVALGFKNGPVDGELKRKAQREAHSLVGGLGTFSLSQGSQLARRIEKLLQINESLSRNQIQQLQNEVAALRQEINQFTLSTEEDTSALKTEDEQTIVLIVDRDRTLIEVLESQAQPRLYRFQTATSLTLAQELLQKDSPHLILFDPTVADDETTSLAFLQDLTHRHSAIPVLILSHEDNLAHRVASARLGVKAYLKKPLPPDQVWKAVDQALRSTDLREAQIMIVDDDPQMLDTLTALLQPWGLEVITLVDPNQFWQTLNANHPDLLVLDVKMPQISGIDLCQVVRNDVQWEQLPVIFLTAHTEPEVVNQVYAVGADDFVSKPIVGPELVVRILNRLERTRLQRRLTASDPLGRVLNRHEREQILAPLLDEAEHLQQPFCLMALELERIRQINDCFGYGMGDRILRHVAQTLLQSITQADIVVRWGGDQFVVGLLGVTVAEVNPWFRDLMTTINASALRAPDGTDLQISCSAGVAHYPEDGVTVQTLYNAAAVALTAARAIGWGQLRSATPATTPVGALDSAED